MPLNVNSFVQAANRSWFDSRDLKVTTGDNASVKLGNRVFSQARKTNDATMAAFKDALTKEYGVFGANAFDMVLGHRSEMHHSLRAGDVKATLSSLATIREKRVSDEINRQLDTSPKMLRLSPAQQARLRELVGTDTFKGLDLSQLKTKADISGLAARIIAKGMADAADEIVESGGDVEASDAHIGAGKGRASEFKPTDPVGLKNLAIVMDGESTSVADHIAKGLAGEGMRINNSGTHPMLLQKLKTNGVEPGFIYRSDWSTEDTCGFMADVDSPESEAALEELKNADPAFAAKCEGKTAREQIMLAGRAHPAALSATAAFLVEEAAKFSLGDKGAGHGGNPVLAELAKALEGQFASKADMEALAKCFSAPSQKSAAALKEAKLDLFAQIRDAFMSVGKDNPLYAKSPVFKHFTDRAIVKLDYNENDKFSSGKTASSGTFMRPERILTTRKPILGQIYRFTSRQSADTISAGAVTEALANDLTRIAGVPSQELEILRGQYSDGHPKIMLAAKFADGYKDLEAGMLKDGRVVPPKDAPDMKMEALGKYKAFFLVTADRDGIGKRGQNKGFINGKFFAIDPGHSLEGNGKYLKLSDDFSFKDTYGKSSKPRFNNFSVFDDDTRFAKLSGVLHLRELAQAGKFKALFESYRAAFNPAENGIPDEEIELRKKIAADIDAKEAEFNESLEKLFDTMGAQLDLYDDLESEGPEIQKNAVETIANLEKLTSPTTWVSKHGKVALDHLEVVPETRVPWKAFVKDGNIVFHSETKMSHKTLQMLETLAKNAGIDFTDDFMTDALGVTRISVPLDKAERFFAVFSEEKVQQLTHPAEYLARKTGGNVFAAAKTYKPEPYKAPAADTRPLMDAKDLPDVLDVPAGGKVFKLPKIHFEALISARSSQHRPRNVGELRALLSAQLRRGFEVLGALMSGRPSLFQPTRENIVALTYAVHAAALAKGEFMYRGSFSIQDKDGHIARWLDKAQDVYLRTSTHAKPYQTLKVDGHLNMPRGYDVPPGAGGLLNGMRTFHYFTIPDAQNMKAGKGANGPGRRLFLKCETFGIFCSTAHFHPSAKEDAMGKGMQTRSYKAGDVIESIKHGASLFASFFTLKEANGIRKENLTVAQKNIINRAVEKLNNEGLGEQAKALVAEKVLDGAGVNKLFDNLAHILENMMPEDDAKRAAITEIFDDMIVGFEMASKGIGGNYTSRIGNEIMIDAKDLQ